MIRTVIIAIDIAVVVLQVTIVSVINVLFIVKVKVTFTVSAK